MNDRQLKKQITEGEKKLHKDKEAIAQKAVQEIEAQLKAAKLEIETAQKEVEKLEQQSPIPEPPYKEELESAKNAVAAMQLPEKGKCFSETTRTDYLLTLTNTL